MDVVLLSIYAVYFANTVRKYYDNTSITMRTIIIPLLIIMIIKVVCNALVVILFKIQNNPGYYTYDYVQKLIIYDQILYATVYVVNRSSIIMLYSLLQFLKYAQMTISREYTSVEEILGVMRLSRIFGRIIVFANIGAIVSLIGFDVVAGLYSQDQRKMETWILMISFFDICVFFLNTLTLCYYYKMGDYFLDLIQDDERDKSRFKLLMWSVISIIIISSCAENLVYPIMELLHVWKGEIFSE